MSRGVAMRTPERVEEARRLRVDGLLLREIAERFGIATKTVHDWLNDTDGASLRTRKDSYRGKCMGCGGPTSGGDGRRERPRCVPCAQRERRVWSSERLVQEARRWHALVGDWPRSSDWTATPPNMRADRLATMREFRDLTGPWPSPAVVNRRFGSWGAFMAAAGGEAVGYGAPGEAKGTHAEVIAHALRRIQDPVLRPSIAPGEFGRLVDEAVATLASRGAA